MSAPILYMTSEMGKYIITTVFPELIKNSPGSIPSCTFSPDSSLMAVGFSESYIRLWNLKGEKLRGLRSDFDSSSIRDCESEMFHWSIGNFNPAFAQRHPFERFENVMQSLPESSLVIVDLSIPCRLTPLVALLALRNTCYHLPLMQQSAFGLWRP